MKFMLYYDLKMKFVYINRLESNVVLDYPPDPTRSNYDRVLDQRKTALSVLETNFGFALSRCKNGSAYCNKNKL